MKNERYAWFVVGVLVLANISSWIDRQILNLLVPAIRADLGISMTQMGYLIGLPFSLFFGIAGFPIARWADRGNRRNIIAGGIAVWSVMTALCGLAGSYGRLMLARIGVGVGEASLQAPGTSLIADYFPRERFGTAMGVYSMAVFIGAGLAYMLGGWVIGVAAQQAAWTLPLVGTLRMWQVVFLFVGIPGLVVAVLMLAVREPERTASPATTAASYASVIAYMQANARTFACVLIGYGMSSAVNIGIAAWLATFFIQKLGWTPTRAGLVMGSLTMTIGALGAVAGGRLSDVYGKRGVVDGPLRVGIIASAGMLVFATAYPFAPTPALTVVLLAVVNFFAAFPWGAANAASAVMVPAPMRAQGVAVFVFVVTIFSALGPVGAGAITDYVFRDDAALGSALAAVNVIGMGSAIALFLIAMPAFRRTIANRDRWMQ